jgi:hypothetical protein
MIHFCSIHVLSNRKVSLLYFVYLFGSLFNGWKVAANILNKQPRTVDKWRSSRLGYGRGANNI